MRKWDDLAEIPGRGTKRSHLERNMAVSEWTEYLRAARAVLSLLDQIRTQLPSEEQSLLRDRIAIAETALKTTEAELAKRLGYRICRCTFPPQVMLWSPARRRNVCARCGDVYPHQVNACLRRHRDEKD
jgi:hypothetical protein